MTEPEDHTLIMIGDLDSGDPWDVELWCRDNGHTDPTTAARWYRTGAGDPDRTQRLSWDGLRDRARTTRRPLAIVRRTWIAWDLER